MIKTPFELTNGMKPRLPEEVGPEAQRLHYSDDFASNRITILQQANQIVSKFSDSEKEKVKKYLDKNTSDSDPKVGDKVLHIEANFAGKNKEFPAKWTGPVSKAAWSSSSWHLEKQSLSTSTASENFGNEKLLKRGRKQMLKIHIMKKRPRKRTKMTQRERLIKVWHLTP